MGFTPGGIEGFVRESGRPAIDGGPAPSLDHDEIGRIVVAEMKYGREAATFDESVATALPPSRLEPIGRR